MLYDGNDAYERIQELEAQLNQVDNVLIVNHLVAKNGDYRKALHDLVTLAISEHDYFEDEKLREQIDTARKLIASASEMMTISVPEWDAEANQFMKETEGR